MLSGRSGSGKTTILRLINGLIPHYFDGEIGGKVTVNGRLIKETPMYRIAEMVGTVYQNPRSQFFNIDTDGEIAFGIENLSYPREELKRRMDEAVKETEIEYLLGRNLFELSGGEKQKVAFASVYAMEPEIYLLDEPSSNLDTVGTMQLRNRIEQLKQQGKTMLITEHRLYYLNGIVDRVIYLNGGKISSDMPAGNFFNLDDEDRIRMGLRAVDLRQVKIKEENKTTSAPIFQVERISAGYKKQAVIQDVSFSAAPGEVIGIVGHNGAGKSTLAETLCGLNETLGGTVQYKGKPVNEKKRVKLGYMVFQDVDYQLFADSVKNECSYGIRQANEQTIAAILQKLILFNCSEKHPAALSGGQKQRLAVAVGMVCEKEVLLFDEPTSGLDLESMIQVTELIATLAEAGKLIFIVTHDFELICRICNRVLLLKKGHLARDIKLREDNRALLEQCLLQGGLDK